eukprot:15571-Prymnesium_polylepis.1
MVPRADTSARTPLRSLPSSSSPHCTASAPAPSSRSTWASLSSTRGRARSRDESNPPPLSSISHTRPP